MAADEPHYGPVTQLKQIPQIALRFPAFAATIRLVARRPKSV
jgi:hypothetical protein